MIKRCCDSCDTKIEGEHIEVSFKEAVVQSFGEFGSCDSHEYCWNCYKDAIKKIEEYQRQKPRREMKLTVKKIMNGE